MLQSVQEMMLKQSEIAALEQVSSSLVFGRWHSKAYQDCEFVQLRAHFCEALTEMQKSFAERLAEQNKAVDLFQNVEDLDCFYCFHSILRNYKT